MNLGMGKFLRGPFNAETVEKAFRRHTAEVGGGWDVQHNTDGTHGNVSIGGSLTTSGIQTHLGLTGTHHNFALQPGVTVLELEPSGDITLTGITAGVAGQRITIVNIVISIDAVILALDDTGSGSANRIQGDGAIGGDSITIEPGRGVDLIYLTTANGLGWHALVKA